MGQVSLISALTMSDHIAPLLQFMSFGKFKLHFNIHSLSYLLHRVNAPNFLKVYSVCRSGVAWQLALSHPQKKNETAAEQAGGKDTNPYEGELCILMFRPLISADKAVHLLTF